MASPLSGFPRTYGGAPAPLTVEGAAKDTPLGDLLLAALRDLPLQAPDLWAERMPTLTLQDVAAHLRFDADSPAPILLAATPDVEAVLSGWLPGHAAPLPSAGLARVLAGAGELELDGERRKVWPGDDIACREGQRLFFPGPGLVATLVVRPRAAL